jgi:hypothetical protein
MSDIFAFCSVSISPLRAEPSDSSEMTSQLLFGETVLVLEHDRQWRKVKSLCDGYEGWTDEKCISSLTELEKNDWEGDKILLFDSTLIIKSNEGNVLLTRGCFISSKQKSFSIGKFNFWRTAPIESCQNNIVSIAKTYLNTPYLWGGKTIFGIDCSGFTQMVYRFKEIYIGRDASSQSTEGKSIPFAEKQAGDLAFFINSLGNIHHVGIILDDNKIIHAHGWLRIDKLDIQGIKHRNNIDYSHHLETIKTFMPI